MGYNVEFATCRNSQVSREVRLLWSSQHELFGACFQDINEIEATGLLVILATWPGVSAGSLWIHFIDNAAAQASLVCGYSSVTSGDDLGLTWEMIAHQRIIPWFDRDDSASYPLDDCPGDAPEGIAPSILQRSVRLNVVPVIPLLHTLL